MTNKINVIGIAGEKGSGKSTVAKYIEKEKGYYHTYFAKTLKKACGAVFGFSDEAMESQEQKEAAFGLPLLFTSRDVDDLCHMANMDYPGEVTFGHSKDMLVRVAKHHHENGGFLNIRKVLQFVGTEMFRDCIHPDFHALCVKHELEMKDVENAVISDARFPNERKFIKEVWGGKSVLVHDMTLKIVNEEKRDTHASENSLGSDDEYDVVIENRKVGFDVLYFDINEKIFGES